MKLVQRIEVSNFRSIRQATLDNLGEYSTFVGLNNSGKSNFLRALNAFFTDEVEPRQAILVDRDYYRSAVRSRRKKIIRVKISFSLPTEFRFRKGLEQVEELLGRMFSITKEWARDEPQPRIYLSESKEPVNLDDRQKVLQFLSLVSFRYVPNRVLPLDIIKQEHQALRDVLIRRLGRKAGKQGDIFQVIGETSEKLIGPLTPEVHKILNDIDTVRLATPKSLADMIFAFGYQIGQGGVELEDTVQGSGVQSLLMYRTLHLIDRDYFQKFGWRQAAIWAVEEPESSLHSSLEANVASFLSTIVREPGNRLQIFATTHSDLVAQYSDRGYFVKADKVGSVATQHEAAELLRVASRIGVSRWVHPILFHPLEPLLLVEGKFDEIVLSRALALLGKQNLVRISYIELLSGDGATGGVDELKSYVRQNASAIKSRSKIAPVLVALDWDSAKQKAQFEKWFTAADPFAVLSWDVAESNQGLHKRFRGIEKFHSDRIIGLAIKKGAEILTKKDGKETVNPEDYEAVKQVLNGVVEDDLRLADLIHIKPFIARLEAKLAELAAQH